MTRCQYAKNGTRCEKVATVRVVGGHAVCKEHAKAITEEIHLHRIKTRYSKNMKYVLEKYGLSASDYVLMMRRQRGHCPICQNRFLRKVTKDGKVPNNGRLRTELVVDHDHETNVVRGLLCGNCNAMLGFARDDVGTLARAISYLNGDLTMPWGDAMLPLAGKKVLLRPGSDVADSNPSPEGGSGPPLE